MAFDANLIVIKRQYNENMITPILNTAANVLAGFKIGIAGTVPRDEYEKMTSSKDIGRYIRIKKSELMGQKKEAYELVKVGTNRYTMFEKFSSSRYAFVSISDLEDGKHTVVWFSFHSKLYRVFREFQEMTSAVAKNISAAHNCETCVLKTSSLSRNSDVFTLYVNGRQRMTESSKGTMTYVRDTYGLDINTIMMNVDKNMAIHYAPTDYTSLHSEYKEAMTRKDEWEARKDQIKKNEKGFMIEKKETPTESSEYIDVLEKDNFGLLTYLKERLDVVEKALKSDPIGTIVYFKMVDRGAEGPGV
jgi:hypothetical protein